MSQILRRDPVFSPLDRIFNQFVGRDPIYGVANGIANGLSSLTDDDGSLALDIADEGEHLVISASLPGFKREDIAVEINDGVLTISARQAKVEESEGEQGGVRYYRRERHTGSLARRVTLPAAVDQDQAKAALADGVLTLRLPKSGRDLPKRISID